MLHQIDNIYSTVFVVNVSKNVLLLFVDAFDELIHKIMQLISNICLRYSILYLPLNFIAMFRTIATILQIYCWSILIWATL